MKWDDFLIDPGFQSLSVGDKRKVAEGFKQEFIEPSEEFKGLNEDDKNTFTSNFMRSVEPEDSLGGAVSMAKRGLLRIPESIFVDAPLGLSTLAPEGKPREPFEISSERDYYNLIPTQQDLMDAADFWKRKFDKYRAESVRPKTGKYTRGFRTAGEFFDPYRWASNLIENAPMMGIYMAMRTNPALGLAFMATVETGDTVAGVYDYEKKTGEKLPEWQRRMVPAAAGLLKAKLEDLGISAVLGTFSAPVAKRIGKALIAAGVEGTEEFLQQGVDILVEAGYKDVGKAKDVLLSLMDAAYAGFTTGGLMGGALADMTKPPSPEVTVTDVARPVEGLTSVSERMEQEVNVYSDAMQSVEENPSPEALNSRQSVEIDLVREWRNEHPEDSTGKMLTSILEERGVKTKDIKEKFKGTTVRPILKSGKVVITQEQHQTGHVGLELAPGKVVGVDIIQGTSKKDVDRALTALNVLNIENAGEIADNVRKVTIAPGGVKGWTEGVFSSLFKGATKKKIGAKLEASFEFMFKDAYAYVTHNPDGSMNMVLRGSTKLSELGSKTGRQVYFIEHELSHGRDFREMTPEEQAEAERVREETGEDIGDIKANIAAAKAMDEFLGKVEKTPSLEFQLKRRKLTQEEKDVGVSIVSRDFGGVFISRGMGVRGSDFERIVNAFEFFAESSPKLLNSLRTVSIITPEEAESYGRKLTTRAFIDVRKGRLFVVAHPLMITESVTSDYVRSVAHELKHFEDYQLFGEKVFWTLFEEKPKGVDKYLGQPGEVRAGEAGDIAYHSFKKTAPADMEFQRRTPQDNIAPRFALLEGLGHIFSDVTQSTGQLYNDIGEPVNAAIDNNSGKLYLSNNIRMDTIGHEATEVIIKRLGLDNSVVQAGIREFGGKEALSDAVGEFFHDSRLMPKGIIDKITNWLKLIRAEWRRVTGADLSKEDIVAMLNRRIGIPTPIINAVGTFDTKEGITLDWTQRTEDIYSVIQRDTKTGNPVGQVMMTEEELLGFMEIRQEGLEFQRKDTKVPFFQDDDTKVYNADYLKTQIPKESIDLIVTSPPYNIGMQYAESADALSIKDHEKFTKQYLKKLLFEAKDKGRLVVNIPEYTRVRGETYDFSGRFKVLAREAGWTLRETHRWEKGAIQRGMGIGTAASPWTNPGEIIAVFHKGQWKGKAQRKDLTRKELFNLTDSTWKVTAAGNLRKSLQHPAPAPVRLFGRAIKLYSSPGETVLDPFVGAGTTIAASKVLGRKSIGVELSEEYAGRIMENVGKIQKLHPILEFQKKNLLWHELHAEETSYTTYRAPPLKKKKGPFKARKPVDTIPYKDKQTVKKRIARMDAVTRQIFEDGIVKDMPDHIIQHDPELLASAATFVNDSEVMDIILEKAELGQALTNIEDLALYTHVGMLQKEIFRLQMMEDLDIVAEQALYKQAVFLEGLRATTNTQAGRKMHAAKVSAQSSNAVIFDLIKGVQRGTLSSDDMKTLVGVWDSGTEAEIKVAFNAAGEKLSDKKAQKKSNKWRDLFYAVFYEGILSATANTTNAFSNFMWLEYQGIKMATRAGVETVFTNKLAKKLMPSLEGNEKTIFLNQALQFWYGINSPTNIKKAFLEARKSWRTGIIPPNLETKWQIELGSIIGAYRALGVSEKISRYLTPFSRSLIVVDVYFKALAGDAYLNAQKAQIAKSTGRDIKSIEATTQMKEDAHEFMNYVTFMNKPGALAQSTGAMRRWISEVIPGARLVIPFVNTMSNVFNRALEMTPGFGIVKGVSDISKRPADVEIGTTGKFKQGPALQSKEFTDLIANQIEGTVLTFVLLMLLNDEDRITGEFPRNPAKQRSWYALGKKPHSIRVGNYWIPYRKVEPFNMVISNIIAFRDAWHEMKDDETKEAAYSDLVWSVMKNLVENTYLDNISRALKSKYGFKEFAKGVPASFVPFSGFWRQVNRTYESYQGEGRYVRENHERTSAIANVLPWFIADKMGITPPPRIDAFGEEIIVKASGETGIGRSLQQWLPFAWSKVSTDPVEIELNRMEIYPGLPSRTMKIRGEDVYLPLEFYREYSIYYGKLAKEAMIKTMKWASYKEASDETKSKLLDRQLKKSHERARAKGVRIYRERYGE